MYDEGTEITVSGFVRADDFLPAPLTGALCVGHSTHARVWSRLDLAGVLVDDLVFALLRPFVLETGGEPIYVAGGTFIAAIKPADVWPHPAHAAALLRLRDRERYLRSTFFDQVIILPGEWITVTGVVAHDVNPEAEHGYRETAVLTRLVGYAGRPLTIAR